MESPGPELVSLQREVEARARDAGLSVPEVEYRVVDHRELNAIAAWGGFPVRYPHWRFGMDYDRLIKGHAWGLSRIYELVVNTEPVVAYLLRQNAPVEQKLVMAHVCGHADFFRANAWFAHTDRDMMDRMADHAARVRAIAAEQGAGAVEDFLDRVHSLDNLVDPSALRRARGRPGNAPPLDAGRDSGVASGDILGRLLLDAPLAPWEQELLALMRDEAYYFLPQLLTKIMNEGWASFWHSRLMTGSLLRYAEVVDYADSHSGAMGGDEGPMNPYKLGIELFRHLLQRSGGERAGLPALFDARAVHDDLTFVDALLDEDFARAHGLAATPGEFEAAREQLLASLTNGGQPVIRMRPGPAEELELEHVWSGSELRLDHAEETLRNIEALWRRPLWLRTRLENRAVLLTCSGGVVTRELGEPLPPDGPPA